MNIYKNLSVLLSIALFTTQALAYNTTYWNWKIIDTNQINFPKTFLWGTATHAYNVEGNTTNNTWYAWETHTNADGTPWAQERSENTCDHWNCYRADIQHMKKMGLKSYAFSIEWSKVEPHEGHFDSTALQHYADVCNELVRNGIKPVVILKDYRDPLWFAYRGGFEQKDNIKLFVRFCAKVFEQLHDKTHMWITFWSPESYATNGYLQGKTPPGKKNIPLTIEVLKNTLEAHVSVYKKLKSMPGGKTAHIGITKHVYQLDPWNSWNPLDHLACFITNKLINETFYDFFTTGTFAINIPGIGPFKVSVNHKNSYAPKSLDFIGINHYSHGYINNFKWVENPDEIPTDIKGFTIYPEGLYLAIKEISQNIATKLDIPMYVTQNGIATADDSLQDLFLKRYMYALSKAVKDGFDVRGYFYWTLMDGYLWGSYDKKMGLLSVDHDTQKRTRKNGAQHYIDVIKRSRSTKQKA